MNKIRLKINQAKMKSDSSTVPFPHTEYRTSLPDSAEPVDRWDELVNFIAWNYLDPDKWGWVFRGVSQASYPLKTRLEREVDSRNQRRISDKENRGIDRRNAEEYLLAQFKTAAHHFLEYSMVPDKRDTLEWLALMQHYGAPTRLLDFTRSPYIACFFALEKASADSEYDSERAIWAIDTVWLIKNSLDRIEKFRSQPVTFKNLLDSEFIMKHFRKIFVNNRRPIILPVIPARSNPRLLVQQGLFLCSGPVKETFENILLSYKDSKGMKKHVHKILINEQIRNEVLSELNFMNISRGSLFPDLEGFATSLNHKIYYKSSDETRKLR
jgi:hypothetical protein